MIRKRKTKPGKKTLKLINALEKKGWVHVEGTSGKYKTFEHPNRDTKLFVGRSAALRAGKNPSNSYSLTNKVFYKDLMK